MNSLVHPPHFVCSLRIIVVAWLLAAALISGSFASWIAYADDHQQGSNALRFGERVTGNLDHNEFRRLYVFDGRANEVISLVMTRLNGDLDPYLIVTNEDGTILALSDDDGTSTNAEIPFKRLPATGRYFIIATRFGQEHGITSGEYSLQMDRVGTEADENTVLQYGDSIFGRVTSQEPTAFYFLRAQRGDVINITMRRTSGDLDPQLELATADGIVLITNDDDPNAEGTLDAEISTFTILEDGIYLIIATRFGRESGLTTGSYVLSVEQVPVDLLGTSPQNARLLDYGMTLNGELDDEIVARYFHFRARRGDVITATLSSKAGNLDPLLKLLDSDFSELAQDDDSGGRRDARIAAFTLPATGTYYLVATRSGEEDGRTEGQFSLEINGRRGVAGGQALEIMYGVTVSGQIGDANPSEEYLFFGQHGDTIRITMSRASGDLDSLITLYDSDRKQIAFDDDSGGDKDALISNYVLPDDAMYILVASRFERELGQTSGAYMLTLDLIRNAR